MTRRRGQGRAGGFTLVEALLALTLLGTLLLVGTTFFARRRALERDRLDREQAARALASEWTVLRTSPPADLRPRPSAPFLGPPAFLSAVAGRQPRLSVRASGIPGLVFVRLEIRYGRHRRGVLVQEGYVLLPPEPPPEPISVQPLEPRA